MKRRTALGLLATLPFATRARAGTPKLPVIGLGTWRAFEERDAALEVLSAFASLGGALVDTAPSYGAAESIIGERSGGLFVATKVWASGRKEGAAQIATSMRALRKEKLDLVQVHNLQDLDAQLDLLEGLKQDGRVRFVGVTHFASSGHEDLGRVIRRRSVDFIQVNYSAMEREAERRLLPLARDRGVGVIVNRPFAGGDLLRIVNARPLPSIARDFECTTWAQLLLKFVVGNPAVSCVIPATSKVAHLRDNMQAAAGRMPDDSARDRIAAAVA